mgnify:CR=1 FL=1
MQRCPYGDGCFVEKSRDTARAADLVVTNHALLAINAMHGGTALPDHQAVIIDEAHELVSRVTGAASCRAHPAAWWNGSAAACLSYVEDEAALELLESADGLATAFDAAALERVEDPTQASSQPAQRVRNAARAAVSAMTGERQADPDKRQASAAVKEVFDIAERMAALQQGDVVWVGRPRADRAARLECRRCRSLV